MFEEDKSKTASRAQLNLPGKAESLWTGTSSSTHYPSLEKGVEVDVAILGGGIAGMTAAYFLQRAGFSVAILEAARIGAGTSGNTTAKVTALHTLKYSFLRDHFGKEGAKLYADSHQWAIEEIERLVTQEHMACDFHRSPAYTYTQTADKVDEIHQEAEAAHDRDSLLAVLHGPDNHPVAKLLLPFLCFISCKLSRVTGFFKHCAEK
jgi:glycine/D-amino acid oxidase-like deaminating enzyme